MAGKEIVNVTWVMMRACEESYVKEVGASTAVYVGTEEGAQDGWWGQIETVRYAVGGIP